MATRKKSPTDDVVIVGVSGLSSGGRSKPLGRSSRKQELRSELIRLRHLPSGREGVVEIPPGHYSKREMQRLREEAKERFRGSLGRALLRAYP